VAASALIIGARAPFSGRFATVYDASRALGRLSEFSGFVLRILLERL